MKPATLAPTSAAPDPEAVCATVAERDPAEFVKRGIAAIWATKHDGSGIRAEFVIAKLEAKLAAVRQAKAQRGA